MRKPNVVTISLIVGLVAGILIPNISGHSADKIAGTSYISLLWKYMGERIDSREYFLYLIKNRGMAYAICGTLGFSIFGVPISVLGTLAMGMVIGGVLSSMMIQGGVSGFITGMLLLLPHYLIYVPVFIIFYTCCYEMSMASWHGRQSKDMYRSYIIRILILSGVLVIGIFLESYVSPFLIRALEGKI